MIPGVVADRRPPRRHGHEPHRVVAVLPVLGALLRAGTCPKARTRTSASLCVQAYNDWMVDEWCGDGAGRMIPLCLIPLWDAELAAAEVRRNAARGVRAVAFSEIPPKLGLPSIHSDYWDPLFRACAETGTVVCMHIGSSSTMPSTSLDAPGAVGLDTRVDQLDLLDRRLLDVGRVRSRSPISRSRTAKVRRAGCRSCSTASTSCGTRTGRGVAWPTRCPTRRAPTCKDHVYFCIFQDKVALENLDVLPSRTDHLRGRLSPQRLDMAAHQGHGRAPHGEAVTRTRRRHLSRQRHPAVRPRFERALATGSLIGVGDTQDVDVP